MLKLWNVFSDLVTFWSIFWTLLRVFKIIIKTYKQNLGSNLWEFPGKNVTLHLTMVIIALPFPEVQKKAQKTNACNK